MTNHNLVETTIKAKDTIQEFDPEFKWGEMPPQDISGQLTRSMLEMRKPKAYELKEPPALPRHKTMKQQKVEFNTPDCPIMAHSIELLEYIRQASELVSKLENKPYAIYGYAERISELSQPPPFQSNQRGAIPKDRRSRSSSSGKGDEQGESLFCAPKIDCDFRDGKTITTFPCMSTESVSEVLKSSVIKITGHTGYAEIQSSCLNVLTGVASSFMKNFSDSIRDALDHEAETGHTPFYDVLHTVLNEAGIVNIEEIRQFWNNRILKRHKRLQKQAAELAKEVQSMKYRMQEVKLDSVQVSSLHGSRGKWTPVAGMSSGPFRGERPEIGTSTWTEQTIKQEPYEMQSAQPLVMQRVEQGGVQANPLDFNPVKLDDNLESAFEFSEFVDYQPLRKKSRNT